MNTIVKKTVTAFKENTNNIRTRAAIAGAIVGGAVIVAIAIAHAKDQQVDVLVITENVDVLDTPVIDIPTE